MLGLNRMESQIAQSMITTADTLVGFDVVSAMGPVEGIIEKGFSRASVAGLGIVDGGCLPDMVFEAKQLLAQQASAMGASAVIGFRLAIAGRELEKSVIAYGIAVKCKKQQQGSN